MNYRQTEILDAKTLSGAGTEIIPINVKEPISRLTLQWIISKANLSMQSYAHKDIVKIELTDGSDVLHSLDGGQNQALCIYDRKCFTMNHGQYIRNNSQRSLYGIDFGRFLYDPVLAFDPARFNNPMLKVTFDSDVSDEAVTSGTLEVWADVFDEKVIAPLGFLMAKEHFNAGTPDSGYTYVDLPTDYPYRRLLVQGYHKAFEPWYVINSIRLNEDNGKRIPFDVNSEVYYQRRKGIDPPCGEHLAIQATDDPGTYYLTATDYWAQILLMPSVVGTVAGVGGSGRGGYYSIDPGATSTNQGVHTGWLPNHCFHFPFGNPDDIEDWYDVTKIGSLRLRLEEGTHHDDQRQAVCIQQLRRY